MKLEQSGSKKKEAKIPTQKLEDILPFIKPSKEEVEFYTQAQRAQDLFSAHKITEATELMNKINVNRPIKKKFSKEEEEKFTVVRAKLAEQLGYKVLENKGERFSLEKEKLVIIMHHFISHTPMSLGYKNGRISEIEINSKNNSKDKLKCYGDEVIGLKNKELKKIFDELIKYFN